MRRKAPSKASKMKAAAAKDYKKVKAENAKKKTY